MVNKRVLLNMAKGEDQLKLEFLTQVHFLFDFKSIAYLEILNNAKHVFTVPIKLITMTNTIGLISATIDLSSQNHTDIKFAHTKAHTAASYSLILS